MKRLPTGFCCPKENEMRFVPSLIASIFALILLPHAFVTGQIPDPSSPVRHDVLKDVITIDSPADVQAEIANAPQGWTVEKGPGAKYGFLSLQIEVNAGKTSIGCVYGNKGQFGAFVLSRKVPDGLVCKVENESVHPRFVTCRPKGSRRKD